MNERRFESRFLCADLVRIEWRPSDIEVANTPGAAFRTVEAVLEDISALGACVQVEEHIPPGTAISISVSSDASNPEKSVRFRGEVSYCVYRDYGYFVGIRFSNETRWSSGLFEPEHLTNLEALMLMPETIGD
jgi:hypothetical protein